MMVADRAWSEALVTAPCLKPCPVSRLATSLARPATGVPLRTATVTEPRANAGAVPWPPPLWAAGWTEAEEDEEEESSPPISCVRPKTPAARTMRPATRPAMAQRRERASRAGGAGAGRGAGGRRGGGAAGGGGGAEPVAVRGRGTGAASCPRPLARAGGAPAEGAPAGGAPVPVVP